ncbi:hypothetical protein OsI_10507 [Oryza sativa Indica Group]|uniref:Uncharacterized protein n=1 Tax=Oryza sativa subsp. indica TaxID=39946 RepID=B8AQS5_ORYSI|nr:hypothetical protein OsI_10507 [Oryza sativa Indica Group]
MRSQGGNGRRRLTLAPSWTTSSKGLAASLSPAKSSSEECERACFRLGRLVEAAAASATRPRAVHGSSAAFDQCLLLVAHVITVLMNFLSRS